MPRYMLQFSYTSDAWKTMMKNPVDRTTTISDLAKSLGGKFESLSYTMGEYDGFVIAELPDDATAMAFALRATGGGHVKATKTTKLFSAQEAMTAMKKAGEGTYSGPS